MGRLRFHISGPEVNEQMQSRAGSPIMGRPAEVAERTFGEWIRKTVQGWFNGVPGGQQGFSKAQQDKISGNISRLDKLVQRVCHLWKLEQNFKQSPASTPLRRSDSNDTSFAEELMKIAVAPNVYAPEVTYSENAVRLTSKGREQVL
jgi:hypothetical protein